MWCENCNRQFDTDEKNCPECGNELIDYTPILDEDADLAGINDVPDALSEEEVLNEDIQMEIESKSQLLVTVIGEKEAKRIIKLLTENRIPAFEKIAEQQDFSGLDDLDLDDDFEDDDIDDFDIEEDLVVETLTPPQTAKEEEGFTDDTLYDIFVPENDFPEAMSLMLEKDKDRDATIIDDLSDIIPEGEDIEDDLEDFEESTPVSDSYDYYDNEDIHEEQLDDEFEDIIEEIEETKEDGKSKGGFWNLFRK